jgi:uncharacterized membrane protein YhaH (DUF805 family)
MRGQILSFDDASGAGLISGDDGIRYTFAREAVSPPAAITSGLRVDFVPIAGEATNIMLLAAAPVPGAPSATPGVPTDGYDFARAMFSFEGRMRRSHFWISWAILFVSGWILNFIPVLNLLGILMLWPHFAIGAKRLHDMGHTGWLIAAPYVVGLVGFIAIFATVGASLLANYAAIENEDPAAILAMIGPSIGIVGIVCLIQIGFLIWIGVVDSQRGDNRFGPNPKGE